MLEYARRALLIATLLVTGACASLPGARTTYSNADFAGAAFENFLVIGVAGSYNNRAQFEREVVSGLREAGVDAAAFYNLAGDSAISRDSVLSAVKQNQFDAVVVTRVKSQQGQVDVAEGSTGTRATTIGGRPINFFRYDYVELNEPDSINLSMSVTLTTEVFAAAEESLVQAFEISSSGSENVGALINISADAIVRKLVADGRIGR